MFDVVADGLEAFACAVLIVARTSRNAITVIGGGLVLFAFIVVSSPLWLLGILLRRTFPTKDWSLK